MTDVEEVGKWACVCGEGGTSVSVFFNDCVFCGCVCVFVCVRERVLQWVCVSVCVGVPEFEVFTCHLTCTEASGPPGSPREPIGQ